jgi:hypothetical protein
MPELLSRSKDHKKEALPGCRMVGAVKKNKKKISMDQHIRSKRAQNHCCNFSAIYQCDRNSVKSI